MTSIEQQISYLQPNQVLKISPNGLSMYPFFVGGRDTLNVIAPTFPLRRGQIALYLREDGTYVIHRIYKVKHDGASTLYYMLGDHQTWIEGPLQQSQIHAVAVQIIRKNKMIDCNNNLSYRFLSRLWLLLRPIRPILFRIRSISRRICTRIRKSND